MLVPAVRRAYTLVEVLVVVTVLGIAGALIVPSISSTDVLRVQGAVRTIVSDMTVAQSDAIAFQRSRALVFHSNDDEQRYVMVEVNGATIDETLDRIDERRINIDTFGFARFDSITFLNNTLIFDPLGGPVTTPTSGTPADEAWVDVTGSRQTFRLRVEAYTGRITVQRIADDTEENGGG